MSIALVILKCCIRLSSPVILTVCISKTKCTIDIEMTVVQMTVTPREIGLSLLGSKRERKNLENCAARYTESVMVADVSILNLRITNIASWTVNTIEKIMISV